MLTYKVTNTREETVTVDGLGVLPPGETEVDEVRAEHFKGIRGLTLVQVTLPEGIEVAVVISADKEGVA